MFLLNQAWFFHFIAMILRNDDYYFIFDESMKVPTGQFTDNSSA